jgi:hypothetical protein
MSINQFPYQNGPKIIAKKDENDLDGFPAGLCKSVSPVRDSPEGYSIDKLKFTTHILPATQQALQSTRFAAESGTCVLAQWETGLPTTEIILGQYNQVNNPEAVAGNSVVGEWLKQLEQVLSGKRLPPNLKESVDKGARVVIANEKNQFHKHAHTKGLDVSLTIAPLLGQYMPEIKNIETAIQQFASIPTQALLSQLPGSILNLSSLINKLTNSQRRRATQNMPSSVATAFESITTLLTQTESSGTYLTSGRIHEETYVENMIDLLSQVTNLPDLITVVQRLYEDESIRGMEKYAKQAYSGLLATVKLNEQGEPDNEDGITYLNLSGIVDDSIIYFDDGYSLNISNKTYIVVTADQNSNQISVYPTINQPLTNEKINVYLPVAQIDVEGPYGPMTMTMDMNGNVSPNRETTQKIQQAIGALVGLMNSAQAGGIGQNLFGPAAGLMSKALQFIPNNIRAQLISEVANKAKTFIDPSIKKLLRGQYPGKPGA